MFLVGPFSPRFVKGTVVQKGSCQVVLLILISVIRWSSFFETVFHLLDQLWRLKNNRPKQQVTPQRRNGWRNPKLTHKELWFQKEREACSCDQNWRRKTPSPLNSQEKSALCFHKTKYITVRTLLSFPCPLNPGQEKNNTCISKPVNQDACTLQCRIRCGLHLRQPLQASAVRCVKLHLSINLLLVSLLVVNCKMTFVGYEESLPNAQKGKIAQADLLVANTTYSCIAVQHPLFQSTKQ